jgi:hypothetical protein
MPSKPLTPHTYPRAPDVLGGCSRRYVRVRASKQEGIVVFANA